jgi:hypothetical protein
MMDNKITSQIMLRKDLIKSGYIFITESFIASSSLSKLPYNNNAIIKIGVLCIILS